MAIAILNPLGATFRKVNPRTYAEKRIAQFREIESNEWMATVQATRKERNEQEQAIDRALFAEKRERSNWLENREMRVSALVVEHQRPSVMARVELRKRIGKECPALLKDKELASLQDSILRGLSASKQARRDDYQRRAHAAGIHALRESHRDDAPYGDLEALARREIRQLALSRSLGRLDGQPSSLAKRAWKRFVDAEPIVKLLTALISLGAAAVGLYIAIHKLQQP